MRERTEGEEGGWRGSYIERERGKGDDSEMGPIAIDRW